jgi:putative YhdH/YhfP family quinone oxidoreductase
MSSNTKRCIIVRQIQGQPLASVELLDEASFGSGEVHIAVKYSSLNYKDVLACQGHPGIVRTLPHIPGIDLAGHVVRSCDDRYKPGDAVVVTGFELGQAHWGGWSELAVVPADWIVPLPSGLSLRESMWLGTAGLTAAGCFHALQRNGIQPSSGPIAVTGASGGVGSIAVQLLAQAGFDVTAVSGKMHLQDHLISLGAARVLSREDFISDDSKRPMMRAVWAGAIDTVGGQPLQQLLRSTVYGGCVAACGLVAGADLNMTVYPFLLRGISLCGVASADCPAQQRAQIWQWLSGPGKPRDSHTLSSLIGLDQVLERIASMSKGDSVGRVVIRVD